MKMGNKILMPQLISMLAASSGKPKKQAEAFLKAYFSTITSALEDHDVVKIKDFGTFKVNRVEARKSINVATGEENRIPPHYKIVFTPTKSMADKVNKEFAWLDIVEISDEISNEDLEAVNGEDFVADNADITDAKQPDEIGSKYPEPEKLSSVALPQPPVAQPYEEVSIVEPLAHADGENREEELEQSEHLGEELEKDFGDIEPAEPFGPVDPGDPEPGEPIPEDIKENGSIPGEPTREIPVTPPEELPSVGSEHQPAPEIEHPKEVTTEGESQEEELRPKIGQPEEIVVPESEPEDTPKSESQPETESQPAAAVQPEAEISSTPLNSVMPELPAADGDFDPYAVDIPEEPEPPAPEHYYITKEEFENLATKADLRIIARNIKKVRGSVDACDERSKERSKKALIWSLILCAALVTGGFFLTYFLLLQRFESPQKPGGGNTKEVVVEREQPQGNEADTEEESDEEYAPSSVAGLSQNNPAPAKQSEPEPKKETSQPVSPVSAPAKKNAANTREASSTAPTSPSDIKAMDKITTTRYLTTMAKEYYGNYNLWPYIYLENEGKLGHPDRIKPGTKVVIPNIEKYNIDPSNPKDIEKARKLGVEIYKKYASN